MAWNPLKQIPANVDAIIEDVETLMQREDPESERYQHLLKTLERLETVRSNKQRKKLDPNQILVVLANLLGIALVLNAERLSALSSKVWGLLLRPRS
jgi:recombinational DNA repair protein (RecF pathway)